MPKCIVLGAGASYGYDDSLSLANAPPRTLALLSAPAAVQLLELPRYAALRSAWEEYLASAGRVPGSIDAEVFFEHLASRLTAAAPSQAGSGSGNESRKALDLQEALGGLWYFFFELFKSYLPVGMGPTNNYARLARSFKANPFLIVSLNYDPLLEASILASGGSYYYPWLTEVRGIPILKVHGSVTWLNDARGFVSWRMSTREKTVRAVMRLPYTNRMKMRPLKVIRVEQYRQIGFDELVHDGANFDIPGLLPPIGNTKDYEQLNIYQVVWRAVDRAFNEATEIVFVGTSLREQDTAICDALALNLRAETPITIVGNYDVVKSRLDRLLGWTRRRKLLGFRHFGDWTQTL